MARGTPAASSTLETRWVSGKCELIRLLDKMALMRSWKFEEEHVGTRSTAKW